MDLAGLCTRLNRKATVNYTLNSGDLEYCNTYICSGASNNLKSCDLAKQSDERVIVSSPQAEVQ
jgi:hypothetical protein